MQSNKGCQLPSNLALSVLLNFLWCLPSLSISITDQMPEVNFSLHCWDPASPAHPNLYKCPKIEEGILACQKAGKKVLISLGGATGNNDLKDDQAKDLAKNLWDLFLGGKERPDIRPFGR